MATVKDMKKGFCDDVYIELESMKERIMALQDQLARDYQAEDELFGLYDRHLHELVDQIEWKLQILSHACPYDWKGSAEYEENSVSVGTAETFPTDFSGGYIGG
ncbi:MAG: hypothetical protein ACM3MD_01340 [Betaproteobacteria bacterium]